jgi:AraC family transcriptional activator of mtrCDE
MDSLGTLVSSLRLHGRVDLLCRFAGMWSVNEPERAPGSLRYHAILSGHALLDTGQARIELGAGDLVLFPHGAAHTLHSLRPTDSTSYPVTRHSSGPVTHLDSEAAQHDYDMLCGSFELEPTRSLLWQSLPEVIHLPTGQREDGAWLLALLRLMRHESARSLAGADVVVDELSRAMFTIMLRILIAQGSFGHGLLALLADPRLAPAIAAVVKAPAEPWTLQRMAAQSRMSRASFARHFAQLGHTTPLELVTALRMELAARLLRDTRRPLELIGEACGYAARPAFGRAFKRYHGVSPAAFRRDATTPEPG